MSFTNKFYSLKMGLAADTNQASLIQHFKSNGDDVIQTSDGLCLKSQMTKEEVESFLKDKDASRITVQAIDRENTNGLSKDVLAFMG